MSVPPISTMASVVALLTLCSREQAFGTRRRRILSWVTGVFIVVSATLSWSDKPVPTTVPIFYQEPRDKDIGVLVKTALDRYDYEVSTVYLTDQSKWKVFNSGDTDVEVRYFHDDDRVRADLIRLVAEVAFSKERLGQRVALKFVKASSRTIEIWIPRHN